MRTFWIVLLLSVACTGAVLAAGVDGWRGAPDGCLVDGQCFCERDRGGWIRQPANGVSNAGFVIAGLAIAGWLAVDRRRGLHPRPDNPMTATDFFPGFAAVATALLGPGSLALHASLTRWGSVLDLASMNAYVAFLFLYAVHRTRPIPRWGFVALYLLLNAVLLAIKIGVGHGSAAFGAMALATLALEWRLRRSGRARADGRWLAGAVLLFATAFAIWLGAQNDGPLCDPDSWLQGHALWHVLCAATAFLLYGYARSERPRPSTGA